MYEHSDRGTLQVRCSDIIISRAHGSWLRHHGVMVLMRSQYHKPVMESMRTASESEPLYGHMGRPREELRRERRAQAERV